jgi:hypothetical protein
LPQTIVLYKYRGQVKFLRLVVLLVGDTF